MSNLRTFYFLVVLTMYSVLFSLSIAPCFSQESVKIGAYYFDGWTGKTYHISENLKTNFKDREPIWGWVTSTQEIIDNQILLASEAGLDFFNFCWYYTGVHGKNIDVDPKNNALKLYLSSKEKSKLKFSLMIANHGKHYTIKQEHWNVVTDYWCKLFADPHYLRVDDKPLITFFSLGPLVETFGGSTAKVREALDDFRAKAKKLGVRGVSIAVCLDPRNEQHVDYAKRCGFDILTGYNYPQSGFDGNEQVLNIAKLLNAETVIWDKAKTTGFPYIPVTTLNWDQRAWEDVNPSLKGAKRYTNYSKKSVKKSVANLKKWLLNNPEYATINKVGFLYAWNEYGEGAWLTPSIGLSNKLLKGLKQGLR
ncbi:glycoside hydrolase family 99-like domain-containing protein [Parapedobacter sp. 2B3]|uniref:glycoside hydrolase family 99-like domain-containing protein n=1 Tax=Parapedobacter sp. 2B3 TaxID=3342381 RepID=UPI0035B62466